MVDEKELQTNRLKMIACLMAYNKRLEKNRPRIAVFTYSTALFVWVSVMHSFAPALVSGNSALGAIFACTSLICAFFAIPTFAGLFGDFKKEREIHKFRLNT
jgi:hypothetical protein